MVKVSEEWVGVVRGSCLLGGCGQNVCESGHGPSVYLTEWPWCECLFYWEGVGRILQKPGSLLHHILYLKLTYWSLYKLHSILNNI